MKPNYKRKQEKRSNHHRLYAPISGRMIPLSSVPDPVFGNKMFGDGVAINPADDVIVAPCNANVAMIPYFRQSIGLETDAGDMILIHIGTNCEVFRGKGFETLVSEGSRVRPGTPLIRMNRRFLESQNADMTVCMVITNLKGPDFRILDADVLQAGRTPVMEKKS